jgi:YegS/Rv2252/BmrU family lipid kinase
VAVGGDGTIHEVANGFFDDAGARVGAGVLGVLPFGTGGDFRKTAHIDKDFAAAAKILRTGRAVPIDIGRLEYRRGGKDGPKATAHFINIASFGMAGLVDQIINKSSKALGGKVSFFIATARAGMKYKKPTVRVVCDGDEAGAIETRIQNVAVANGKFFGGGMRVAPDAELDDGKFDVVNIGNLSFMQSALSLRKLYAGTHVRLPEVVVRRATRVDATAPGGEEVLLDVDGEQLGALPATFTLLPKALSVMVP